MKDYGQQSVPIFGASYIFKTICQKQSHGHLVRERKHIKVFFTLHFTQLLTPEKLNGNSFRMKKLKGSSFTRVNLENKKETLNS